MNLRLAATLVLLIATSAAAAQTVDPHELILGTFAPGPRDRSVSLAAAPHGMLLAWSEADETSLGSSIRTVLLNFDGERIGEVNTLSPTRDIWPATSPVVTTDGQTFFVTWLERDPYNYNPRAAAGLATDAHGQAAEPARRLHGNPVVVWDGLEYRIHENAARRLAFATPDANGWIDWSPRVPGTYGSFGGSRPTKPFTIEWHVITPHWIRTGKFGDLVRDGSSPAVSAEGDDLLIVWSAPNSLRAMRVIDGEGQKPFEMSARGDLVPSLAGSLVVYEHGGDIYGSIVGGSSFGKPFPISAGPERDELPRVYQFGTHRYLVIYVRDGDLTSTVAARYVDTTP